VVRRYSYAVVNDRVLLVEPGHRRRDDGARSLETGLPKCPARRANGVRNSRVTDALSLRFERNFNDFKF
jgi:hypothetical protein